MAKGLAKAMERAGQLGVKATKQHIRRGTDMWKPPIDTGAMRSGIHISNKKKMSVTIQPSSKTPYAQQVHQGTKNMRKRPFFEITEKHEEKNIAKFFDKELEKIAKDILK